MDNTTVTKLQELIQQGEKILPEGGLEFSGYNAKMQSHYLLWRKNCLDVVAKLGEKGTPLRTAITNDENGAYFYQSSAQIVLDIVKQALTVAESASKIQPSPIPASTAMRPSIAAEQKKVEQKIEQVKPEQSKSEPTPAMHQIKPSEKIMTPIVQQSNIAASKKVLVIADADNPYSSPLSSLLQEIGIEEATFQRSTTSSNELLGFVEQHNESRFAFFLFSTENNRDALFELGYLIGKLGANRVCCIHSKDVQIPKDIPGVTEKEIVVKLEEVSLSVIRDLKAAGYAVSI